MQTNPRFIAGLSARYAPDLRRYVPKFWESAIAAARRRRRVDNDTNREEMTR